MTRISLSLLVALLVMGAGSAASATEFKLATLAPVKSSWTRIFQRAAREIKAKTEGAVTFRIYARGVQGDEKKTVAKMRTGQLQAAAVTAVSLGEIAPEVLVLQAPQLITNYRTLDAVRAKLKSRFEAAMTSKGYTILGWGDVGLTYIYSQTPVVTPADLKKTKFWVGRDDPFVRKLASIVGFKGKVMGVPDVLAALNTNRVDALISSPLACQQLGWCRRMKYRAVHPFNVRIEAVIIPTKTLQSLSSKHQKVVKTVWDKWLKALVRKVRKENGHAVKTQIRFGMQDTTISLSAKAAWKAVGNKIQKSLVGKLYPSGLLNQVRGMAR